jgi:DNA-binding beta-propeller fold protein YncE
MRLCAAIVLCVLVAGTTATAGPDHAALAEALRSGGPALTLAGVEVAEAGPLTLNLERFAVTTPATRFVVGRRGGGDVPLAFDPASIALYRGGIAGHPGGSAFLAAGRRGLAGSLTFAGGRRADIGAVAGGAELPPGASLCGLDSGVPAGAAAGSAGGGDGPGPRILELAIETDYEYFQLHGSLESAAEYVVQLYAAVSDIYQRDVGVVIQLTFVRLWDTPEDLFNDQNPLGEFRQWWNENMTDVPRDLAQLLSGRRNLPWGGIAYLSALCGNAGYSVCAYVRGSFADLSLPNVHQYDVFLAAHELGHNCGTPHTHDLGIDNCLDLNTEARRGTIMSYCSQTVSGGNANIDLRFHLIPQDLMREHISSVDCLLPDCNGNGIDDRLDVTEHGLPDANGNLVPDGCEDCNANGVVDEFDITLGESLDQDGNGLPDECDPDCNGNGLPDGFDIALGTSVDLHGDGVPDECDADCNGDGMSDYNQLMADMPLDLDRDTVLDQCQDCDGDGTPDVVALEGAHHCWVVGTADGTVRQFHPVTGVLVRHTPKASVAFGQDVAVDGQGRVYVSSRDDHRVARFDRFGNPLADYVPSGAGGLSEPAGLCFAPGGDLLVASGGTASVIRYQVGTGQPLGHFVAPGDGGLVGPFGLAFGPSGNLFVTSADNRVLEFDGASGALVRVLVSTAGSGGLSDPRGIAFKPDGNLLVTSHKTNQVLEYDGAKGLFIGQFNHGGTDTALTLDGPWGVRVGPDGDVYVSRFQITSDPDGGGHEDDHDDELHINSSRIYIFDGATGNFLRSYVTGHDTGLDLPTAFAFTGHLELDRNRNQVPDDCECLADVDGSGAVDVLDLVAVTLSWGVCAPGPCPADIDGDGAVGVGDMVLVVLSWGGC